MKRKNKQPLPTPQDAQRLEELAALAERCANARERLTEAVCNYYCDTMGKTSMNRQTNAILSRYVEQHGVEMVFKWIDIARTHFLESFDDRDVGKYISGIRRKVISDGPDKDLA